MSLHVRHLEAARRANHIIYLVVGLIAATLVWANFATLEEVVVGQGQVVPSLKVHRIQSLDGGLLKTMHVTDGQKVKAGEPLLELDSLRFASAVDEARVSSVALDVLVRRLDAEIASVKLNDSLDWQHRISLEPARAALDERSLTIFNARLSQLANQLEQGAEAVHQKRQAREEAGIRESAARRSLKLAEQELEMTRDAVREGAVAELELIKLERDAINLRGELSATQASLVQLDAAVNEAIAQRRTLALEFINRAEAERHEAQNKLDGLNENIKALADRLERTRIEAPIDGSINNIAIRTPGSVIEPGQTIMELVPSDGALIVESRVDPKDIAFVHQGLGATVKFSAYDFVIYGGLKGEVVYVSPDAHHLEDGTTYFEVHIRTHSSDLGGRPIIPGMQTTTDIQTGSKTVLEYWLKPLLRAKANALREP
ncbi:HlyD family type I secretion periplasmic adaptor subunit [Shewanella sp. JM162201]|uniref:Membrane fusion protein (MFP) family protein n=1 Tax=Shewanella jiangmenensis TaxID=2837387 RepID=A0ABS5V7M6_9GAMM|nr:HlyD family type I secretion periplasmic adaptor subunit [Shewanella jiangmenensis]MBT1446430.1 HlyD family type I secretion periplasmic adaptor subunit [Shewanella jiangmenensis]